MSIHRFSIPAAELEAFCHKWKIVELSIFGSATRDDFHDGSDLDLIATFADDAEWSVLDHAQMEIDLEEMLGRDVDLVTRTAIEASRNPWRRRAILGSAKSIYRAA